MQGKTTQGLEKCSTNK